MKKILFIAVSMCILILLVLYFTQPKNFAVATNPFTSPTEISPTPTESSPIPKNINLPNITPYKIGHKYGIFTVKDITMLSPNEYVVTFDGTTTVTGKFTPISQFDGSVSFIPNPSEYIKFPASIDSQNWPLCFINYVNPYEFNTLSEYTIQIKNLRIERRYTETCSPGTEFISIVNK